MYRERQILNANLCEMVLCVNKGKIDQSQRWHHSAIMEWVHADAAAKDASTSGGVPVVAALLPTLCMTGVLHCGAYVRCVW